MLNIPEEVKDLFKRDSVRKNIRIHFPNGEREDITNSNLIAESFSFTESVMSQSEFRFGLCEASMVEFECFGVENIKGYEIEVSHEIDISSLGEEFIATYGMTSDDVAFPFYRVPYGKFTVDEALRQSDMVRRKITAYGKMLDSLKPSEIELLKTQTSYGASPTGTFYEIDLIKYVYANSNFEEDIPNSNIVSISEKKQITTNFCDNLLALKMDYLSVEESFGKNSLFKITLGERLLSMDDIFNELLDYILELSNIDIDIGGLYQDWDSFLKTFISDSVSIGMNVEKVLGNEKYIYGGVDMSFKIPISATISANYGNPSKEIIFRNQEDAKIEGVYFDDIDINVSYPLKKSTNGFYYLKDIPYDQVASDIEEAIELQGKFGKVDRYGNFQMISIGNDFGLYPSEDLYPSETLYPQDSNGGILTQGNYISAWYDDEYTKPYDRVSVSYKNSDGEEMYAENLIVDIESDTYNASDYQSYSLSENSLIQNGTFTEAQLIEILQTVGESLRNIQYMPCELNAIGIPWIEAGDGITVITNDGGFETLVLNRKIDGIQSLTDNITAD